MSLDNCIRQLRMLIHVNADVTLANSVRGYAYTYVTDTPPLVRVVCVCVYALICLYSVTAGHV